MGSKRIPAGILVSQEWKSWKDKRMVRKWSAATHRTDDAKSAFPRLPQQAQTIELISGLTYIRKRISLTFFVKKLILWSEGLSRGLLSDTTYFVYRAVTFFNEIDLHPHNSSYIKNIVKIIRRTSSIIDQLLGLIYTPIATSVTTLRFLRIYIIFNKINKAAYVRSRAAYRLKIIARTSSIIN